MLRIHIKQDQQRSWLLWWSLDGYRWYPINRKHVQPIANGGSESPFAAYKPYRDAMNRVYQGFVETFEGNYDRETKKLRVEALSAAPAIISKEG